MSGPFRHSHRQPQSTRSHDSMSNYPYISSTPIAFKRQAIASATRSIRRWHRGTAIIGLDWLDDGFQRPMNGWRSTSHGGGACARWAHGVRVVPGGFWPDRGNGTLDLSSESDQGICYRNSINLQILDRYEFWTTDNPIW